ncbi:hypothetical protein NDU88_011768 [Pleurodeles waltl]|uniref:Uncharacterized protein n=1 Tax=Pleurodeles waltl TaxID=8319 RepID=A0AAV7Q2N3_PLEWA|nr:hypothetical protein NDU88_011768 [Pleurodeles waltl]
MHVVAAFSNIEKYTRPERGLRRKGCTPISQLEWAARTSWLRPWVSRPEKKEREDGHDERARFPELETLCSRLSFNPAQDASDWRCPRGVQEDEDGVPRSLGNNKADTFPENPDIRVLSDTKREDGLHTSVEEKDEEEPGSAKSGRTKKSNDDRRTGNHGVPKEAADPGRKGSTGDTLTDRHAPGGTWLTMVRSFLKDNLRVNRESYGRRGEGRDRAEREKKREQFGGNREVTRRGKEKGL